ncbi:hypothetical protein VNO77_03501 [Canavalia gladiata]|uniref:Uncharacterized protein n=1 Tax=Canavalia gladiata TaxID=3824 RepID=A0AAN9MZU7_CANGL
MPSPTNPAWAGSRPLPPLDITATLSYVALETSARNTTFTRGKPSKYCSPGYVSTKPSMNSVITSLESLMSFLFGNAMVTRYRSTQIERANAFEDPPFLQPRVSLLHAYEENIDRKLTKKTTEFHTISTKVQAKDLMQGLWKKLTYLEIGIEGHVESGDR